MASPTHLSESELARGFVQPRDAETLPGLLKRCIPHIQHVRAKAYGRLNVALRRTIIPDPNLASTRAHDPSVPHLAPPVTDYPSICANVTEDLKLASEAVMELHEVVRSWSQRQSNTLPHSEISTASRWLDTLQNLEEKKLVATVSLHALQRSTNQPEHARDPASAVREKVSKYSKELNQTDQDINDLLQEIMEFCMDSQENVNDE